MPNSGLGVLNEMNGGGYELNQCALTVDFPFTIAIEANKCIPQNTNSFGIYSPPSPSNGKNIVNDSFIMGYGIGLITSDHMYFDRSTVLQNRVGIFLPYGGDLNASQNHNYYCWGIIVHTNTDVALFRCQ